jgi:hypothetical protein
MLKLSDLQEMGSFNTGLPILCTVTLSIFPSEIAFGTVSQRITRECNDELVEGENCPELGRILRGGISFNDLFEPNLDSKEKLT